MQVVDFIDFRAIFEKVKLNQLKEFPTKESYQEFLSDNDEDFSFVEELYNALAHDFKDLDTDSSDSIDDVSLATWLADGFLWLEFSEGGNNATEAGDNYWGWGFQFKVDLDSELFTGYLSENYG